MHRKTLTGCSSVLLVGNLPVIYAATRGSCTNDDLEALCASLHIILTEYAIALWIRGCPVRTILLVPSKDDSADEPNRVILEEAVAPYAEP